MQNSQVEYYPRAQWARRDRGNGLFDQQIESFLKLKVELQDKKFNCKIIINLDGIKWLALGNRG
jgi:hypothetical protein